MDFIVHNNLEKIIPLILIFLILLQISNSCNLIFSFENFKPKNHILTIPLILIEIVLDLKFYLFS